MAGGGVADDRIRSDTKRYEDTPQPMAMAELLPAQTGVIYGYFDAGGVAGRCRVLGDYHRAGRQCRL